MVRKIIAAQPRESQNTMTGGAEVDRPRICSSSAADQLHVARTNAAQTKQIGVKQLKKQPFHHSWRPQKRSLGPVLAPSQKFFLQPPPAGGGLHPPYPTRRRRVYDLCARFDQFWRPDHRNIDFWSLFRTLGTVTDRLRHRPEADRRQTNAICITLRARVAKLKSSRSVH